MNRYSEISTSQFDPMSFEQIAAPAMMKRAQHDKALADQQLMIQGLAKVQPHEKFYTEAQRLKGDIENKLNTYASRLSQEGVNSNTQGDMIALNREYQNLIAPTGKLGMINEHNQALQKTYADTIEKSIKMGNSEAIAKQHANIAVQRHMQEPLYNPKTGQVIPFTAGAAPKYVDPIKFTDELASKAKMSSTEWKRATSGLKMNAAGDRFVIDQSKAGATGTNRAQLQEAADLINLTLNDPRSELRQSLDYNYKDVNDVRNQLAKQLGIYVQDEKKSSSDYGISSVDWKDQPKVTTDASGLPTGITQETVTIDPQISGTNEIDRIGQNAVSTGTIGSPLTMGTDTKGAKAGGKWTYQDISNPTQKKQYVNIWNSLYNKGVFPIGTNINDPQVAKVIAQKIKDNGPVTLSTKIIKPDITPNEYMFAGELKSKDINTRSNTISAGLRTGRQHMQDPEDPSKVLTPEEFRNREYKIQYDSHLSPINFIKNPFGNSAQGAVPHQVIVTDKKGKTIGTALVDRPEEEIRSNEGRASQELHNIYKNIVTTPNTEQIFNTPRLKQKGFPGLKAEYVTIDQGLKLEEPRIRVRLGRDAPVDLTTEQFTKLIYDRFTSDKK